MKITTEIFEKRLFLFFLLVGIIIIITNINEPTFGTWGINKTVGWAYDLTLPNLFITFIVSVVFTLVYFLLFAFKKPTNKALSIIQIVLFTVVSLFYDSLKNELIFLLNFLLIIVFLINVIWALINKQNQPAHNRR